MINKKLLIIIVALISILALANSVSAACDPLNPNPFSGSGTVSDPYLITDCCQLQAMNTSTSAHYLITNYIDCSITNGWNGGQGFKPINDFYGSLDGNDNTIFALGVNRPSEYEIGGLVKILHPGASIKNIAVSKWTINGRRNVGGFVDENNGEVSHITGSGLTITNGEYTTGGIAAVSYSGGSIHDITLNNVDITGHAATGGVAGKLYDGGLYENYDLDNVRVTGTTETGGLAGRVANSAVVNNAVLKNVLVTGSQSYTGGIAARVYSSSTVSDSSITSSEVRSIAQSTGGAFGRVEHSGTIINNILVDDVSVITTGDDSGLLIGDMGHSNPSITLSRVTNSVINSSANNVGGLIGYNGGNNFSMSKCSVEDSVIGNYSSTTDNVGGLAGIIRAPAHLSEIKISGVSVNVNGSSAVGSAMIGTGETAFSSDLELRDSYVVNSVVNVINKSAGYGTSLGIGKEGNLKGTIKNVFVSGLVNTAATDAEPFLAGGFSTSLVLEGNYYDSVVYGTNAYDLSSTGSDPKTTSELHLESTFPTYSFGTVWGIGNGYPCLLWEDSCSYSPTTTGVHHGITTYVLPEDNSRHNAIPLLFKDKGLLLLLLILLVLIWVNNNQKTKNNGSKRRRTKRGVRW